VDVRSCISIASNQARLACFDQSAAEAMPKEVYSSLESPAKKSTPAVNTTSTLPAKKTLREAQAVNTTSKLPPKKTPSEVQAVNTTSKLPPKKTPREVQKEFRVEANITEARTIARGKWLLKLDNGQTWQEVEPGRNRYKPGLPVTIESGFMGSYTLKTKGKKARKFKPIY
jgi:hypothetical protein